MTLADRILAEIKYKPLDDDVLAQRLGVGQRQSVNQVARKLEESGLLRRYAGADGKIVNEIATAAVPTLCGCGCGEAVGTNAKFRPGHDARHAGNVGRALAVDANDPAATGAFAALSTALQAKANGIRANHEAALARKAAVDENAASLPAGGTEDESSLEPGDSSAQRLAEPAMLAVLGAELGVELKPRRLHHRDGARVELDGADDDLTVLVECWAHQGMAKVAQRNKLVNDAMKLQWVASWLHPRPERLIICVSDELAVKHLRGTSWQGQAIAHAGVELHVVSLDEAVVESIIAAQKRQFR